jgi:ADP-heptose:LPS heptosyltransferase
MKGKRIMLWRYGAFGDLLYTLPVIDRLREQGNVLYLHTGFKGKEIFDADTRFEGMTFYEPPFFSESPEDVSAKIQKVMDEDVEGFQPDLVVNLSNTIETTLIPSRGDDNFEWSIEQRRNSLPGESFYSLSLAAAGLSRELLPGECGTAAFYEWEIEWAKKFRGDVGFLVLMALAGSNAQKRFPQAASIARKIVEEFKDAYILLVSDPETLAARRPEFHAIGSDRIKIPDPRAGLAFRRALLLARYADYVIGPETGLLVGAGMWGTPKTMLCTTSSVAQAVSGHIYDHSLQSSISCSPCLRAIYKPEDCYLSVRGDGRTPCNDYFNEGEIFERIELVHRDLRYLQDRNGEARTAPLAVPDVWADHAGFPVQGGPVRKGLLRALC